MLCSSFLLDLEEHKHNADDAAAMELLLVEVGRRLLVQADVSSAILCCLRRAKGFGNQSSFSALPTAIITGKGQT
jgi:hypothetical protein